jgi:hypothetical protein
VTSVVVVIPSRGRPERARIAVDALRATAVLVSTSIVLGIDETDPCWVDYREQRYESSGPEVHMVTLRDAETGDLVRATNTLSVRIAAADPDAIIGNLGDDHVARTPGWDRAIRDALTTPGIAYGDDLFQRERLPTAPFISAAIVNALGWYAPPGLTHLFIDNAWRDLGAQSGCLRYLPDVVFEHVHPLAGKADWDDGYVKVNRQTAVDTDAEAYRAWRDGSMASDVETVRKIVS